MKLFTTILLLCLSTTYADCKPAFFKFYNKLSLKEESRKSPINPENDPSKPDFTVTYYRCEWETDPQIRFIKAKITPYFSISNKWGKLYFDLHHSLRVDSVTQGSARLPFFQANDSLVITLSNPEAGKDSVSIYYQGVPGSSGFGSYVNDARGGKPVMWTLSEPFGSRDWWPCQNGLNHKVDSIDVYITTPEKYTAVSNGLVQSITTVDGKKTTHWKHRYPIATYLICMAVAEYREFTDTVLGQDHPILMQSFCYPQDYDLFKNNTAPVFETMKYFSDLIALYPFYQEKYGHAQFGWGGGMEHQTTTFIVTPDESLMAHELAHQWFGNTITVGSWRDVWLSEGFATMLASIDMERKYPSSARQTQKEEIENITSIPTGSVFVSDTTSVGRIFDARLSYKKASRVLFMLKWILGDDIFWKAVRSYFNDPTLKYGFATTSDFKNHVEKVAGKSMDSFFNNWIYSEGFPSYKVRWQQVGSHFVKIKIEQETAHPSVPFFALPLELEFANGSESKRVVVDNTKNEQEFFLKIDMIADTLLIDPDYRLISRDNLSIKTEDNSGTKNALAIYPNPVKESLKIYLKNSTASRAALQILDAGGRKMISSEMLLYGNSGFEELNTSKLAAGTYYIQVKTNDGFRATKRIVKN